MSRFNSTLGALARALVLPIISSLLFSGCTERQLPQALGTLERDRIALQATASEVITEVAAVEGSQVEQGQLLLRLDDRKQQAMVAHAQAEVQQAAAFLAELRNGTRPEDIAAARARMNSIQAQLTEADKNFIRTKALMEKKLVGEADLDDARARRDSLTASLHDAREQLRRLTNGPRTETLQQAEAALAKAEATLNLEQRKLADLSIHATRRSQLDTLPKHLGERVTAGTTVAVLLADEAPYARVYIPEPSRAAISVGDALTVHVDGVEQSYIGKVRWIASEPAFTPYYALSAKDRARLVYLAEVQLPSEAAGMPVGLPAQVDLPQ